MVKGIICHKMMDCWIDISAGNLETNTGDAEINHSIYIQSMHTQNKTFALSKDNREKQTRIVLEQVLGKEHEI